MDALFLEPPHPWALEEDEPRPSLQQRGRAVAVPQPSCVRQPVPVAVVQLIFLPPPNRAGPEDRGLVAW